MTTRKGYRQARQVLKYREDVRKKTGRILPVGEARKQWLIIQKIMDTLGGLGPKKALKILKAVDILLEIT